MFGSEKMDQKPYNSSIKPYSPDLVPCDFWAFPSLKTEPRGKKTACSTILLKLAANGLQHVFEKWVERCRKCIACQGRYFEKETVTAPPQSSYRSILILTYPLRLSLPSSLIPSGFPSKNCMHFSSLPCVLYAQSISSSLIRSL
jgi:hypothetical protein